MKNVFLVYVYVENYVIQLAKKKKILFLNSSPPARSIGEEGFLFQEVTMEINGKIYL